MALSVAGYLAGRLFSVSSPSRLYTAWDTSQISRPFSYVAGPERLQSYRLLRYGHRMVRRSTRALYLVAVLRSMFISLLVALLSPCHCMFNAISLSDLSF